MRRQVSIEKVRRPAIFSKKLVNSGSSRNWIDGRRIKEFPRSFLFRDRKINVPPQPKIHGQLA